MDLWQYTQSASFLLVAYLVASAHVGAVIREHRWGWPKCLLCIVVVDVDILVVVEVAVVEYIGFVVVTVVVVGVDNMVILVGNKCLQLFL